MRRIGTDPALGSRAGRVGIRVSNGLTQDAQKSQKHAEGLLAGPWLLAPAA